MLKSSINKSVMTLTGDVLYWKRIEQLRKKRRNAFNCYIQRNGRLNRKPLILISPRNRESGSRLRRNYRRSSLRMTQGLKLPWGRQLVALLHRQASRLIRWFHQKILVKSQFIWNFRKKYRKRWWNCRAFQLRISRARRLMRSRAHQHSNLQLREWERSHTHRKTLKVRHPRTETAQRSLRSSSCRTLASHLKEIIISQLIHRIDPKPKAGNVWLNKKIHLSVTKK